MTPPETPQAPEIQVAGKASPAVPFSMATLRKRSDFLRAARAQRQAKPGFILQARRRRDEPSDSEIRVGCTCSKKVGNAVARNRAKRRLREIARAVIPFHGKSGWDYVLIGRQLETSQRDYQIMVQELLSALSNIHSENLKK